MYPEPSRYRTVHYASVKPAWVEIDQLYTYFIHFEPRYIGPPVRLLGMVPWNDPKMWTYQKMTYVPHSACSNRTVYGLWYSFDFFFINITYFHHFSTIIFILTVLQSCNCLLPRFVFRYIAMYRSCDLKNDMIESIPWIFSDLGGKSVFRI